MKSSHLTKLVGKYKEFEVCFIFITRYYIFTHVPRRQFDYHFILHFRGILLHFLYIPEWEVIIVKILVIADLFIQSHFHSLHHTLAPSLFFPTF